MAGRAQQGLLPASLPEEGSQHGANGAGHGALRRSGCMCRRRSGSGPGIYWGGEGDGRAAAEAGQGPGEQLHGPTVRPRASPGSARCAARGGTLWPTEAGSAAASGRAGRGRRAQEMAMLTITEIMLMAASTCGFRTGLGFTRLGSGFRGIVCGGARCSWSGARTPRPPTFRTPRPQRRIPLPCASLPHLLLAAGHVEAVLPLLVDAGHRQRRLRQLRPWEGGRPRRCKVGAASGGAGARPARRAPCGRHAGPARLEQERVVDTKEPRINRERANAGKRGAAPPSLPPARAPS